MSKTATQKNSSVTIQKTFSKNKANLTLKNSKNNQEFKAKNSSKLSIHKKFKSLFLMMTKEK